MPFMNFKVKPDYEIPPEVKQRLEDLEMKILDLQVSIRTIVETK